MSQATTIVLLSQDFNFLNLITIRKAIKLISKNKVEVIKSTDKMLRVGFPLPQVIRLLKHINISLSKKIPFSKQNIFVRDDYVCQYCGRQLNAKTATVDHIIPQAKGGKNSYTNCTTACRVCNQWKGDKHLHETSMHIRKMPHHPTFLDFMYLKAKALGVDMKTIFS